MTKNSLTMMTDLPKHTMNVHDDIWKKLQRIAKGHGFTPTWVANMILRQALNGPITISVDISSCESVNKK